MSWQHPTGNTPQAVHVVCAGYTQREYCAAVGVYGSPVPTDIEVWTLNKALRSIKADFGFVLDDLVGENNKDQVYVKDLGNLNIPLLTTTIDEPVKDITKDHLSEWHEYPIHGIRDSLGNTFGDLYKGAGNFTDKDRAIMGRDLLYMKNSLPMILAYAWYIGVRTVFLWGADYTHPAGQRREDDQPNAEFWVGFLKGQGVQVILSGDTTLCSIRDGRDLYGYGARQPRL